MGSKVPPMTPMRRLMSAECSAGSPIPGGHRWNRTSRAATLLPRSTGTSRTAFLLGLVGYSLRRSAGRPERPCREAGPTRVEGDRRMARIELQDVSKVYTGGVRAVNALRLDIPDGDFMVFVGPSGCGKSTALRMVAG